MIFFKRAILLVALASSSMVMAQDKSALVRQFVDMQRPGIESLARGMVQQWSDPIAAAGAEYLHTRIPEDKREAASKAADAELKKYFDENYPIVRDKALASAQGAIGPILEQDFTDDELKQVMAWLSSPLSKKYQDSAQKMQQALAEKIVADMRPTMEPKLRALDANVAKALGAPPAGGERPAAKAPAKSSNKK
ncbi:MAG: DUF2059 domain-containing protein [Gammaproteobacteria bacterium]|nr:DUF2059 domain-containing protein [Gammaproteobacteria bacterium]MBU2408622.1 DUF2059 domain-containing protein [Gammaproteobacteria bacterium]